MMTTSILLNILLCLIYELVVTKKIITRISEEKLISYNLKQITRKKDTNVNEKNNVISNKENELNSIKSIPEEKYPSLKQKSSYNELENKENEENLKNNFVLEVKKKEEPRVSDDEVKIEENMKLRENENPEEKKISQENIVLENKEENNEEKEKGIFI